MSIPIDSTLTPRNDANFAIVKGPIAVRAMAFADFPAATTLPAGTLLSASDQTYQLYVTTGSAWVAVSLSSSFNGVINAWGMRRPNSTLLLGSEGGADATPAINLGSQATTIRIDGTLYGDLTFQIANNHVLHVEDSDNHTSPGIDGGNMEVAAADGGGGHHAGQSPDTDGGRGGNLDDRGGVGGYGTAAKRAGDGGRRQLRSGGGGEDQGAGGGASGDLDADTGAATGAATNGVAKLGTTNAERVDLGRSGKLVRLIGTPVFPSYTTAGRPSAASVGAGAAIYDTTIGKPTWSTGAVWKDAAGNTI